MVNNTDIDKQSHLSIPPWCQEPICMDLVIVTPWDTWYQKVRSLVKQLVKISTISPFIQLTLSSTLYVSRVYAGQSYDVFVCCFVIWNSEDMQQKSHVAYFYPSNVHVSIS